MSEALPTYGMGGTQIPVGLSATVRVVPPLFCNGGFFKLVGGGTLAIVSGISALPAAGYLMGSGEAISMSGPASFYLAASGATATVHCVFTFSQGWLGT